MAFLNVFIFCLVQLQVHRHFVSFCLLELEVLASTWLQLTLCSFTTLTGIHIMIFRYVKIKFTSNKTTTLFQTNMKKQLKSTNFVLHAFLLLLRHSAERTELVRTIRYTIQLLMFQDFSQVMQGKNVKVADTKRTALGKTNFARPSYFFFFFHLQLCSECHVLENYFHMLQISYTTIM